MRHKFADKLTKEYKKRLKKLCIESIDNKENCLNFFVAYLQFMRDYYAAILTVNDANTVENYKLDTLATAVSEFNKYNSCINNYYNVSVNGIVCKDQKNAEEIYKQYIAEKTLHWNYFWELVNNNIEGWFN